eukprot:3492691-Rhodomonas_salina.1
MPILLRMYCLPSYEVFAYSYALPTNPPTKLRIFLRNLCLSSYELSAYLPTHSPAVLTYLPMQLPHAMLAWGMPLRMHYAMSGSSRSTSRSSSTDAGHAATRRVKRRSSRNDALWRLRAYAKRSGPP